MPEAKPKKKIVWGCFKFFLYFILLMVLFVVWLGFNLRSGPTDGQPLVEVSPKTTWLTGPLDSNGDVDYLEAINLRCAEGVTTENNAFVKLFQVIGPIPNDAETTNAIAKRLGIDPPQEDGDYFQEFEAWLVQEAQRRRDESWGQ